MLDSRRDVVRCLITYTDWMQPPSSSVLKVGGAREDKTWGDGLRAGLLETVEERSELCRRVWKLSGRDRQLLFMWYVQQLHVDDVSDALKVSKRQCYRRRNSIIDQIIAIGRPREDRAA